MRLELDDVQEGGVRSTRPRASGHSRWGLVIGLVLVVVLGAAAGMRWFGGASRRSTLEVPPSRAQGVLENLTPSIAAEARWSAVRVWAPDPSNSDRIILMGSVETQSDLDALRDHVEERAPEATVDWQVSVTSAD